MNLYILRTLEGHDWDEYDSFVVIARCASEARKLASEQAYSSDDTRRWLSPRSSSCRQLKPSGKARVVIGSFNAG